MGQRRLRVAETLPRRRNEMLDHLRFGPQRRSDPVHIQSLAPRRETIDHQERDHGAKAPPPDGKGKSEGEDRAWPARSWQCSMRERWYSPSVAQSTVADASSEPVRFLPLFAQPWTLPLRIHPATRIGDDDLYELCRRNSELRIERTAEGDLIVMSPTGTETGRRNAELTAQIVVWSKQNGTGVPFDSSTGFVLPNGAERSPDAAWIARPRWEQVPRERREKFAPICPDFVVELRSPSDAVNDLVQKMDEWIANGVRLGWLIMPQERRLGVWRPGKAPEWHADPQSVAADPELSGFVLTLADVW